MDGLTIFAVVLAIVLSAIGLYWTVFSARIHRAVRSMPSIRDGLRSDDDAPPLDRVSIIIPAHNEERVIDVCLQSVREQSHRDIEIIVILDRCVDASKSIVERHAAADSRVILIENDHCPDDWTGKCNAVRIGVERATGRWLLFADADTRFHPQLVEASVRVAQHRSLDMLSLLSNLTYETYYECIAQPVATIWLLRLFPIDRANRRENRRPFANGQFMLVHRDIYERIGGHAPIRRELMEDIHLARHVYQHDGRIEVLPAEGMLHCSMYRSFSDFRRGWQRIFTASCGYSGTKLRKYSGYALFNGMGVPVIQGASAVVAVAAFWQGSVIIGSSLMTLLIAALALQWYALGRIYRIGGAPWWSIACYPIGSLVISYIFHRGAHHLQGQRGITWGGREYKHSSSSATETNRANVTSKLPSGEKRGVGSKA